MLRHQTEILKVVKDGEARTHLVSPVWRLLLQSKVIYLMLGKYNYEKFNKLRSIPSYLALQNIDTDMIIPKQFLKTIKRTGLGKSLFYEMI